MRKILFLIIVAAISVCGMAKNEKKVKKPAIVPVYMYGMSTAFGDSVAYVTDIQRIDSAYMERKHILGGLREYVQQLDQYYKSKGERRVNTVFFKKNRKKAEKHFMKLRKKYNKQGQELKPLPQGEFGFSAIQPSVE